MMEHTLGKETYTGDFGVSVVDLQANAQIENNTEHDRPLETDESHSLKEDVLNAVKRRRPSLRVWRLALNLGDAAIIVTSSMLTALLILYLPIKLETPLPVYLDWYAKFIFMCLALASWKFAANITQSHDMVNASNRFRSVVCALFSLSLVLAFWSALLYPFMSKEYVIGLKLIAYFLLTFIPLLISWRVAFAIVYNLPQFRRQSVIVGVNATGEATAIEIRCARRPTIDVLGYIKDNEEEKSAQNDIPVLGGKEVLKYLIQKNMIDVIIMASDYRANPEIFQEALNAVQQGVSVVPVTSIYELISGKLPVEHIGDQWYMSLVAEAVISPFYLCWQKILDVIFGLIGSLILLMILPIMSALIYFDSPGPIFYSQERLGYQGRKFRIYKFRSMHTNAESKGAPQWAQSRDPRITRVGFFMRATHLDELPQVFNILRGEMSLIGPRPERQEFVAKLERSIPFYRCRLSVKPGLTGWAQVKYRYGNTDQDALIKLQYDLYYIRHRSFMIDIFIMLNTILEVLFRRGI